MCNYITSAVSKLETNTDWVDFTLAWNIVTRRHVIQDAEAVAKDEVQRVLQMTEVRRRQWEKTWEEQRARLEQNLQLCQFFFDLRQVCDELRFYSWSFRTVSISIKYNT